MKDINDLLIVKEASFYSHIFENKKAGVARNLFYCIQIKFEEFTIEENEIDFRINR